MEDGLVLGKRKREPEQRTDLGVGQSLDAISAEDGRCQNSRNAWKAVLEKVKNKMLPAKRHAQLASLTSIATVIDRVHADSSATATRDPTRSTHVKRKVDDRVQCTDRQEDAQPAPAMYLHSTTRPRRFADHFIDWTTPENRSKLNDRKFRDLAASKIAMHVSLDANLPQSFENRCSDLIALAFNRVPTELSDDPTLSALIYCVDSVSFITSFFLNSMSKAIAQVLYEWENDVRRWNRRKHLSEWTDLAEITTEQLCARLKEAQDPDWSTVLSVDILVELLAYFLCDSYRHQLRKGGRNCSEVQDQRVRVHGVLDDYFQRIWHFASKMCSIAVSRLCWTSEWVTSKWIRCLREYTKLLHKHHLHADEESELKELENQFFEHINNAVTPEELEAVGKVAILSSFEVFSDLKLQQLDFLFKPQCTVKSWFAMMHGEEQRDIANRASDVVPKKCLLWHWQQLAVDWMIWFIYYRRFNPPVLKGCEWRRELQEFLIAEDQDLVPTHLPRKLGGKRMSFAAANNSLFSTITVNGNPSSRSVALARMSAEVAETPDNDHAVIPSEEDEIAEVVLDTDTGAQGFTTASVVISNEKAVEPESAHVVPSTVAEGEGEPMVITDIAANGLVDEGGGAMETDYNGYDMNPAPPQDDDNADDLPRQLAHRLWDGITIAFADGRVIIFELDLDVLDEDCGADYEVTVGEIFARAVSLIGVLRYFCAENDSHCHHFETLVVEQTKALMQLKGMRFTVTNDDPVPEEMCIAGRDFFSSAETLHMSSRALDRTINVVIKEIAKQLRLFAHLWTESQCGQRYPQALTAFSRALSEMSTAL